MPNILKSRDKLFIDHMLNPSGKFQLNMHFLPKLSTIASCVFSNKYNIP